MSYVFELRLKQCLKNKRADCKHDAREDYFEHVCLFIQFLSFELRILFPSKQIHS